MKIIILNNFERDARTKFEVCAEIIGPKTSQEQNLPALVWLEKLFLLYTENRRTRLQIQISWRVQFYIRNKFRVWITINLEQV